jgi:hypothetical protein
MRSVLYTYDQQLANAYSTELLGAGYVVAAEIGYLGFGLQIQMLRYLTIRLAIIA